MFYTLVKGALSTVNCIPTAQPDVSALGVRYTHYFQVFLSVLLSFKAPSPWDMILNSLACQAISISLLATVYFDQDVDVVHSVIASHFVVLMMACKLTSVRLPANSLARESRNGMRQKCLVWILDTLAKPVMLLYNCNLWVMIRRLQGSNSACRQGAGYFLFFGGIYPLNAPSAATDFVFAITILQAINHSVHLMAEVSRQWKLRNEGPWSVQRQTGFDARIWWLWKLHRMKSDTVMWDWDRISKWTTRLSHSYKLLTFIYIFIAVEITILSNHIPTRHDGENWTILQIFSICILLLLFGLTSHRYKLLTELIRTTPFLVLF